MDFVDATILRIADESARGALFDEQSLAQILAASHELDGLAVEAPFAPIFDEVTFGLGEESALGVTGSWLTIGQTERTDVVLQVAGMGTPLPRVDLLWAGAVTATSRDGGAAVRRVDLSWLDVAGLDREIPAPLPTDPTVLEQRRRERLLGRIQAGMNQPAFFDAPALMRWLERLGVASVGDLMRRSRVADGATLRIEFGPEIDGGARRRRFAVAAAVLIRDVPLSLAALLDDTRRVRPYLQRLGFAPLSEGSRPGRAPIVVWLVPATLFDDEAWPGATPQMSPAQRRASRREWAGRWLAHERIGLLVPPT